MSGDVQAPELSVSAREYDRGGPCAVVSLAGRASIADCAWVRQLLELRAARAPGRVVIDLSRLVSMDWWVALMLGWVGRVLSRRGGALVLASPQPAVARLLNTVGALKVVSVHAANQRPEGDTPVRPDAAT